MVDIVVHGSSGSDAGMPYPTVTLVELPCPTNVRPGSPEDRASLHSRTQSYKQCHATQRTTGTQHVAWLSWWYQNIHVSVYAGLSSI